jgi:hypothetical protein
MENFVWMSSNPEIVNGGTWLNQEFCYLRGNLFQCYILVDQNGWCCLSSLGG